MRNRYALLCDFTKNVLSPSLIFFSEISFRFFFFMRALGKQMFLDLIINALLYLRTCSRQWRKKEFLDKPLPKFRLIIIQFIPKINHSDRPPSTNSLYVAHLRSLRLTQVAFTVLGSAVSADRISVWPRRRNRFVYSV